MEVGVPASGAFPDASRVVGHWVDTDVLEHDHGSSALDDAEEDVVGFGPLKRDVEPETIAIKGQRAGDILDDEERRNAGNFWLSHVSFTAGFLEFHHEPAKRHGLAVGKSFGWREPV